MWFCDFCDFQQTRKQQLENNIVNVLEHMSRVCSSLYSQSSFFFFLIKTHRERGGSNPSSRPLPFALSHFCDKMFNVFLKKMSFFFFGLVRGRPFVRLNHQTVVVVFLLCSFIVIIVAHAQFLHFFSWLYSSLILNWSNLLNFMVVITRSPPYL